MSSVTCNRRRPTVRFLTAANRIASLQGSLQAEQGQTPSDGPTTGVSGTHLNVFASLIHPESPAVASLISSTQRNRKSR